MKGFPRIFYGWWVLAAGSLITALVGAINVYGFSLFIVPITTEFGWTRTMLSGAISLARLEGGLLGPLEGYLVDKFGPRRMMLTGIPLIGIGFILLGQITVLSELTHWNTLLLFYGIYIFMIALGGTLGTFTPATTAVANWFIRRRGIALGILSSGLGAGATIAVPILAQVIQNYGWRLATLIGGLSVFAIGIPAALVVRHRPEQYGYRPDGDPPEAEAASKAEAESRTHQTAGRRQTQPEQDFTIRQALATKAFWILAFTFAFRLTVTGAVALHLAPLVLDMGLSTVAAGGVISALAGLSIFGRLGLGWLGDFFDKKYVFMGALCTMATGLLVLAFAQEFWHILLFLMFYAPSYGGLASLMLSLRADYFGRRAYATIAGSMGPITTLGTVTGPVFAGYVFDTTGSYRLAMLVFAACAALAFVLISFLKRPRLPSGVPTAGAIPESPSPPSLPSR